MKHTPGPWFVNKWENIVDAKNNLIRCTGVALASGNAISEEVKGNNFLIAAAPDLLQACTQLLQAYGGGQCVETEEIAQKAIAKAEGRE